MSGVHAMLPTLADSILLADEICAVAENLAHQATEWIQSSGYRRTFRDNVLIALSLKIDSSFRALIADARAARIETMHNLKTMVEAFIYFHCVAADTSPETAKRLIAKVLHQRAVFVRENMPPGATETIRALEKSRDDLLCGSPPLPPDRDRLADHGRLPSESRH